MNRRELLKFLGAAGAMSVGGIALLDSRKTYFLPPREGWIKPGDTRYGFTTITLEMPEGFNGRVYYTTDGSFPGPGSYHYTVPFAVKSGSTIIARAYDGTGWDA